MNLPRLRVILQRDGLVLGCVIERVRIEFARRIRPLPLNGAGYGFTKMNDFAVAELAPDARRVELPMLSGIAGWLQMGWSLLIWKDHKLSLPMSRSGDPACPFEFGVRRPLSNIVDPAGCSLVRYRESQSLGHVLYITAGSSP